MTPHTAWPGRLPAALIAFLRRLRLSHRAGGYIFVHAGLRPGVAVARQRATDLLCIREPFLSEPADFGAVVVHGHSVAPDAVITPHRIGIDTGAGLGGTLCCAVLEQDRIALVSVPVEQGPAP